MQPFCLFVNPSLTHLQTHEMLTCIKFGKETVKKSKCIVAEQEKQEELKVKCAQISPLIFYSQPKLTIA